MTENNPTTFRVVKEPKRATESTTFRVVKEQAPVAEVLQDVADAWQWHDAHA